MDTQYQQFRALWDQDPHKKQFPQLTGQHQVDVVIVGGGITGISAAMLLAQAGKRSIILEQYEIGSGTTGHSTGNLYASTGQHLTEISSKHNKSVMKQVAQSRLAAMNQVKSWVHEFGLSCDFREVPWHLFSTKETDSPTIRDEFDAAEQAGLNAENNVPLTFPFPSDVMLTLRHQAQMNPLQYVQQLAASIDPALCSIYENSKVVDVGSGAPVVVKTAMGTVTADHVILATHSPIGLFAVQSAMEVKREYAMAVKVKNELPPPAIYWDLHRSDQAMFSVRVCENNSGKYLLVLHEQHKTGHGNHKTNFPIETEKYIRTHFDVKSISYVWSAQKYSSVDKLPYIGSSPIQKNCHIATGFAADGLVYGTLAALIISDDIIGVPNDYQHLYRIRVPAMGALPKFVQHNLHILGDLVADLLTSPESEFSKITPGEGEVIKVEGKHLAVFRNDEDHVYAVSAICPHMGCTVHWNKFEKSWDCPCHGSRFDVLGEVLEGPAIKSLEVVAVNQKLRNKDQ
jgi:glycine/D-amino acid oxidase-like deaminating enzyme/nitrite reductase/ring-hydroxylating ferredoxin subunit